MSLAWSSPDYAAVSFPFGVPGRDMFQRVLVPVDPADPDEIAASYGIRLADQFGAEVRILSVIDRAQQRDQLRTDFEETVRESITDILAIADHYSVPIAVDVHKGEAAEEIINATDSTDLVVMGTAARDGLEGLVVGSVAESVVEESSVPVMTIPVGAKRPAETWTPT